MGKSHQYAVSSTKIFGGVMKAFLEIHAQLDNSKMVFGNNKHRELTHNSWFVSHIFTKIFGDTINNTEVKLISVIVIAEEHIMEDCNQ